MTNFEKIISNVKFNSDGLVPVIAQDSDTQDILMLAWMNAEALDETLRTKNMCYYSRSRGQLWRKGETSGQMQRLKELLIDCDSDTLLAKVEQSGVACHTGRRSCFFHTVKENELHINQPVITSPEELYKKHD
ncbi:MAG: hisI [Rickettsiaceae bacterium]|jgi:phosphoribosyl-AMP cyclohydrolase|nr:hisI [Rickettsiaceae bacterium]